MTRTGWTIAHASVEGTSHARTGTPCQDASDHLLIGSGADAVLVCVVCDGAGSAAHSDVGSSLAVRTFLDLVALHFEQDGTLEAIDRSMLIGWLERVAQELALHAEQFGRRVRDYACTFLCAIVGASGAAIGQVGDGAIVVSQGADDGWSWVFWPQHGEFANTTNFVTAPDVADLAEFTWAPGRVAEIAVFSDGIENLVLHHATRTVHAPFFERVMKPLRSVTAEGLDPTLSNGLRRYLDTPQFNDRTDDDKTLLLASRTVASFLEPP